MDSSKKQGVKAVQPVGEDVGSSIEAEIDAGDYHFIYSKTYNKSTQTTLDIKSPNNQQMTGREAHERVGEILSQTVDMALWEALLVDQGEKVGLANIQDSTGLASALDEAAGSSSTETEDSDLFAAVQKEYEKYFTLKSGKSKFSDREKAHTSAHEALETAKRALTEIENDTAAYERSESEVRRLAEELPVLKQKADEQAKAWSTVSTLQKKLEDKERELKAAIEIQKAAMNASEDRRSLISSIAEDEVRIGVAKSALAPQQQKAAEFRKLTNSARKVIDDLKSRSKLAKAAFELARADELHIRQRDELSKTQSLLKDLATNAEEMKVILGVTTSVLVDDASLEEVRSIEKALDVAKAKRDSAATVVSVTARKKLQVEFDGDKIDLRQGQDESRVVAAEVSIQIPGVADIHVAPSQSVAELQEEVDESKAALQEIMNRLKVATLQDAIAANEQLGAAKSRLAVLKKRETELLRGASITEVEQQKVSLEAEVADHESSRPAGHKIPKTLDEASSQVTLLQEVYERRESELELARAKDEEHRKALERITAELSEGERELHGLQATSEEKERRLADARVKVSDKALQEKASKTNSDSVALQAEVAELAESLSDASPEAAQALLENANSVLERAKKELRAEEKTLAILADRLEQAQADGRFETMEVSEREFEEAAAELAAIQRRARAVELLWKTLSKHRDETRKAFVRPLKKAIERLGKIVFGGDLEVEIGDDWSLVSRTLNGKTLSFDDLSIGAKEQLGILTRLAAAQIVSTQGGVPLIIDDALGFSDPSRLETMGAAIAAAGKQCQIIILTCTPGRFTHVGNAAVVKF